jgi:MazG family protein
MLNMDKKLKAFERMLNIMDDLREKCPWDRKQTMETLRNLTIEETYELADAIIDDDLETIEEELGDLLLHIVFYAKIGSERKAFDIADVINLECDKLIRRHPHIYGDVKAEDDSIVKKNWEKIKLSEGKKSILQGVPSALPAMVKAYRMQDKAKQVGFEWENKEDVWLKVEEELEELKDQVDRQDVDIKSIEDEFGDVMFSLINYARFLNIDPESALEKTNKKFKKRFEHIEAFALNNNLKLEDMTLSEMDAIWNKAKMLG